MIEDLWLCECEEIGAREEKVWGEAPHSPNSSSKHTKHIKAKYLYIRHYHNSGELDLQYCPTDEMWADGLTKPPLQGSKFCLFWAFLMNCPENYTEDPYFPITHLF